MNAEQLTWYVARSAGIVAWLLLALGLVAGLLLSSRVLGNHARPAWTLSIHRFLGGLGVVFTGVHVVAIMLDDFVDFGPAEVLVPWASSWRPGAVAWGIVAMYLLLAIELTSLAMRRLPKRLWRGVHWASAPLFLTATVHGFQAGTDSGRAFIVATVVAVGVLAALTAVRVVHARRGDEARPEPAQQLRQLREAQARPIRPSPPAHVLDSLTLATKPVAAWSTEAAPNAATVAAWVTAPSAPEPEPLLVAAQAPAGAGVAAVATTRDITAEVSPQPEWDRVTPPPPPPETLDDALPEVPWSLPVSDPPRQQAKTPPDPDEPAFPMEATAPPPSPPAADPPPARDERPPEQVEPTEQAEPPEQVEPTEQAEPADPPKPDPPKAAGDQDAADAPAAPDPDEPAFGLAPPRPSWSDPPNRAPDGASNGAAIEPGRRPGPAPGVWKRPGGRRPDSSN